MPMAWPQFEVSCAVLSIMLIKCSKMQSFLNLTLNIQPKHDIKCSVHDQLFIFVFAWIIAFLFLFCVIFRNIPRSFEI